MIMRILRYFFKCAFIVTVAALSAVSAHSDTYTLDENYGQVPLSFVINEGQFHPDVLFAAEGNACNMFSRYATTTFKLDPFPVKKAAKLAESLPDNDYPIVLYFHNANLSPDITGEDRYPWNSNFFIGNDPDKWFPDVPTYGTIRMNDIYEGIDLIYTAEGRSIDFTLVIQPGADPAQLQFRHTYNDEDTKLDLNDNGELHLVVYYQPSGTTVQAAPECFQVIDGKHIPVDLRYTFMDEEKRYVTFEFGEYDPDYELVIKPELIDSSLLVLYRKLDVTDIDVDDLGNAYVTGKSSYRSLYLMKLNFEGDELGYVTYFGGIEGNNYSNALSIDKFERVYITGYTLADDFPTTEGSFDSNLESVRKCFVIKFNSFP